jgi:hypothetical protein
LNQLSAAEVGDPCTVTSLAAGISTNLLRETRLPIHTTRPGFFEDKEEALPHGVGNETGGVWNWGVAVGMSKNGRASDEILGF